MAAQTQYANVSQMPPAGTPKAYVAACERGTAVAQIASDNVAA
jgi:hypothetical protein